MGILTPTLNSFPNIGMIVVFLGLAFVGLKAMLASIIVLPVTGFFALFYRDVWHYTSNSSRWNKFKKEHPAKATELAVIRKELMRKLDTV